MDDSANHPRNSFKFCLKPYKMQITRPLLVFIFLLGATISISSFATPKKQKKILVFSKTAGFRHTSSIVAGKKYILELGLKNKFGVDTTEKADVFTAENLKQYSAV